MLQVIKLSSFIAIALVVTGCANRAERSPFEGLDQLPPPKTQYAQREYPGPALNPVDDGTYVQLAATGFVFLRDNKHISGNGQFSGTVSEALPGRMVLTDSSAHTIVVLYRLPDSLSLPLSVGAQVGITFARDAEWVNGFSVEIQQNGRLLYAAARAFGSSPVVAVLSSKMYIRQKDNTPSGWVPVSVACGSTEVPVDGQGSATISMAGVNYRTQVLVSLLRATDALGAPGQEGLPYTLEYYTIATGKDMLKGK